MQETLTPPKTMTWSQAMPALIVGGIFDFLRYAFLFFWLWGPAVIGAGVSAYFGGGLLGDAAGAAAGLLGYSVSPAFILFGTIMSIAMAIGGWLFVVIIMLFTDTRIMKSDELSLVWLFIGILGSTLIMAWRMFRSQIRKEKKERATWEAKNAEALQKQDEEQLIRAAQVRAAIAAREEEEAQEDALAEETAAEARAESELAQQYAALNFQREAADINAELAAELDTDPYAEAELENA